MGLGIGLRFKEADNVINFRAPVTGVSFSVQPEEAIKYFKGKGLKVTFDWRDMIGDEHDKAFTVAKMMDIDLLKDVRDKVDEAIFTGKSVEWFKQELTPTLQKAGWWGKQDLKDPLTGKIVPSQLGSARRLDLIFRTNMQTSYSIGQWENILASTDVRPWLMYDAVDDTRTRPEHAALDEKILPHDSAFWKTHFPPNGWNCRCGVIQLSQNELEEYGLTPSKEPKIRHKAWVNPRTGKTRKVPTDLDPGWDNNPGVAYHERLQKMMAEKIANLPPDMAAAALSGIKKSAKAKDAYKTKLAVQEAKKAAAKEQGILELAKSVEAAKQKAATIKINSILENKTPYLYNALNAEAKKSGWSNLRPTEMLVKIQDAAEKAKTNAALAHYKQALIKGKKPSAQAKKAYDDLPTEAKLAIDADIESKSVVIKQQKEALNKLDDILSNPTGQKLKNKALHDELAAQGKYAISDVDDPVALLNKVEAEAAAVQAKASQSSVLSGYKAKVATGQLVTPKQNQVFNSLTEKEQTSFLKKVDEAKSEVDDFKIKYQAAYNKAPTSKEIEGFYKSKKAAKKDIIKSLKEKGAAIVDEPVVTGKPKTYGDLTTDEKYKALYESSGVEDAGVDDFWPDPKEFAKLTNSEKNNLIDDLSGEISDMLDVSPVGHVDDYLKLAAGKGQAWAIASEAPKPKQKTFSLFADPEDWSNKKLTKTGNKKGSNAGGFYQDSDTGEKWYIKTPDSEDMARNEVLAAKLYDKTGLEVPEVRLVTHNGKVSIASRIIDDIAEDAAKLQDGKLNMQRDGFAVDAWLANWDVAGLDYDNLVIKGSRAIRIDVGGSLRYRAQGGLKGSAFGNVVDEIDSLRDAATNRQAAKVFKKVTKTDIERGVARIASISDDEIIDLVDTYGPVSVTERKKLKEILLARKADLINRYPGAVKATKAPVATGKVTPMEVKHIEDARANGYAVPSDLDQIEDQHIVFSEFTAANGEKHTRAWLKIRPTTGKKLQQSSLTGGNEKVLAKVNTTGAAQKIKQALVGINHQYDQGFEYRAVDIERINDAVSLSNAGISDLKAYLKHAPTDATAKAALKELTKWNGVFKRIQKTAKSGSKAQQIAEGWLEVDKLTLDAVKTEAIQGKVAWTKRRNLNYETAHFHKGHVNMKGTDTVPGISEVLEQKSGGTRTRYVPYDSGNNFTTEGLMIIDVRGTGQAAINRAIHKLDEIGVNTSRPTIDNQRELWLDKFMYLRTTGEQTKWKAYMELNAIDDVTARLEKKVKMVKAHTGIDAKTTRQWEYPEGEYQAFNHGRRVLTRPDLDTPEFNAFEKDYHLYHNPVNLDDMGIRSKGTWDRIRPLLDGGGQFASQADRIRRGLPISGSSTASDFRSGGGNYFYTRIQQRTRQAHTGVFIKTRQIKRIDAVSYGGDEFGEVTERNIRNIRKTDIRGFKQADKRSNNETIFKDGFSLFDDVEKIVLWDKSEYLQAIKDMKSAGYSTWPDGRKLEEVFDYVRK